MSLLYSLTSIFDVMADAIERPVVIAQVGGTSIRKDFVRNRHDVHLLHTFHGPYVSSSDHMRFFKRETKRQVRHSVKQLLRRPDAVELDLPVRGGKWAF